MIRHLLCAILLTTCGLAHAEIFNAKVIVVMDGDTVMVLRDGRKIKVRLANIDAPESDQAYGLESRKYLADMLLQKQVLVDSQAMDVYGRMVAELSIDGHSVNETMVSKGMAWEYSHYHGNKRYVALGKQARLHKLGLWASAIEPVAPQLWRKAHPRPYAIKSKTTTIENPLCGKKHLCSQMKSCAEAKIYLFECGAKLLDGNGNGIPCENLCGNENATQH
jgi:micrococcal nuclease